MTQNIGKALVPVIYKDKVKDLLLACHKIIINVLENFYVHCIIRCEVVRNTYLYTTLFLANTKKLKDRIFRTITTLAVNDDAVF